LAVGAGRARFCKGPCNGRKSEIHDEMQELPYRTYSFDLKDYGESIPGVMPEKLTF